MKKYLNWIILISAMVMVSIFALLLGYKIGIENSDQKVANYENINNPKAVEVYDQIRASAVSDEDKIDLFKELLISKYPNDNKTLEIRMWMARKEVEHESVKGVREDIYKQLMFNKCKKFLKYHKNSAKLLSDMAYFGYQAYPEEVVIIADRGIQIDSSITDLYINSSIAHQLLGKYRTALKRLKTVRKILIDRLLTELKKEYPYKSLEGVRLSPDHVNSAKSYLRRLGYDPGKDVNYSLVNHKPKEILDRPLDRPIKPAFIELGKVGTPIYAKAPYFLVYGTHTTIKDLQNLDKVIHFINRINDGDPVWTPNKRLPRSALIKYDK